jgi:hypothetical protein
MKPTLVAFTLKTLRFSLRLLGLAAAVWALYDLIKEHHFFNFTI